MIATLLWDARFSLLTALLAGYGRAVAEVGAVIIVGGNINHATRVMTTTIALETSKGNPLVRPRARYHPRRNHGGGERPGNGAARNRDPLRTCLIPEPQWAGTLGRAP